MSPLGCARTERPAADSPSAFAKLYRNLAVVNPTGATTFLKAAVGGSIPEAASAALQLIAVVDLNEYVLLKPGSNSHLDARYELLTGVLKQKPLLP
jgi:hypothetical protein